MEPEEDRPRLIERAFPLKQASLDSVHEKNVRHGHISTLHIWPARRPLAACRAALIATLLPDPGNPEERKRLVERIGGIVVKKIQKKKVHGKVVEVEKEETVGGVLHWGNENNPDMEWFRQEIRKAYGGRAPRVLDPFAGGGAIPLEAMRLGCEATANDINPVAWFILKCTLEYPQKLAGQKRRLPEFILKDRDFMEQFFKAQGFKGVLLRTQLESLGFREDEGESTSAKGSDKRRSPTGIGPSLKGTQIDFEGKTPLIGPTLSGTQRTLDSRLVPQAILEADLAWHVRAWGRWVLERARKDLEKYYPTVDGKPTVAYLWARTVKCKNCGATIPLLKTRWLCRKDEKRVLLMIKPNKASTGVNFAIEEGVPFKGKNAAERREHDKRISQGTMAANGVRCPCCGGAGGIALTLEDVQVQSQNESVGAALVAVVVDTDSGKAYRPPTALEQGIIKSCQVQSERVVASMPHGSPSEPIDSARPSPNARGMSGLTRYGLDRFEKLFNDRQLLCLATLVQATRETLDECKGFKYPESWGSAITDYLALAVDRVADRNSTICHWDMGRETISNTFQRYALRINWDYAEVNPFGNTTGGYISAVEWLALVIQHTMLCMGEAKEPNLLCSSATEVSSSFYDAIVTDPPYYDAIPYSDLSDFFYVWLRRCVGDRYAEQFGSDLTEKATELIQHAGRNRGDNEVAKKFYERGMACAFSAAHSRLTQDGRFVVVFAHKQPDAWETLVTSIINVGFMVTSSWPIQTEMPNKAAGGARLSSSVWLLCRKRPHESSVGWDNRVLDEMRGNIYDRLSEYWDADIHGPDFVWAATGPALEAYSKHPVVKKANEPGQVLTVPEFLRAVRRIVVDYVVGRVLSRDGADVEVSGLDDVTTYYLLHRNDFKFDDAPAGACILYAVSCGLSDAGLCDTWDLLIRSGGTEPNEEEDSEVVKNGDEPEEEGSGATLRLKPWNQRKRKAMGYDEGRPAPLIDQVHRLMHLWKDGEVVKVDDYLEDRGLRRHELFKRVLQALIELAPASSEERSILESLSNHVAARGATHVREGEIPGIEK